MKKPGEMSIEELDSEIGKRGVKIAELRSEQQAFLDAKDKLVLKETNELRASGAQNLGDTDRG